MISGFFFLIAAIMLFGVWRWIHFMRLFPNLYDSSKWVIFCFILWEISFAIGYIARGIAALMGGYPDSSFDLLFINGVAVVGVLIVAEVLMRDYERRILIYTGEG